jgi:hypothetical protein
MDILNRYEIINLNTNIKYNISIIFNHINMT